MSTPTPAERVKAIRAYAREYREQRDMQDSLWLCDQLEAAWAELERERIATAELIGDTVLATYLKERAKFWKPAPETKE